MRLSILLIPAVSMLGLATPPPMVIVPGLTNSVLEYQLQNAEPYKNCPTSSGGKWLPLYPPPQNMSLAEFSCWLSIFTVDFNTSTNLFQNKRRGVLTRTIDFGGLSGLPALDFLIQFWQQMGWTEGKNLFGAPYDWRYASSGRPDTFYSELQQLVEHAYAVNQQQKVVILTPSFGPQFTLGFLHRMTQAWKDQYVAWYIAISPVFGGVVMSTEYYISGAPVIPYVAKISREEVQAIAVAPWMFPRPGTNATVSWTKDEVIVRTPTKTYSAFDMLSVYTDLGFPDTAALKFLADEPDLAQFASPGVNTYVTYGYAVPTPGPTTYNTSFSPNVFPGRPVNETVSGDNIVPLRSSLRGTVWQEDLKQAGKTLIYRGYDNQPHAGCLVPPGFVPDFPDDGCYRALYAFLINGTMPPSN